MLFRNRFLEYLWFLARVMEDGITDSDEFSSHCIPEASQYTDMRSRRMLEIWICIWFDDMEIARKKKTYGFRIQRHSNVPLRLRSTKQGAIKNHRNKNGLNLTPISWRLANAYITYWLDGHILHILFHRLTCHTTQRRPTHSSIKPPQHDKDWTHFNMKL